MTSRKQVAPPYRAKDLMTVSSFISFCKKHAVRTDRQELEFFDKQSLLLPTCRVLYGSVEMSRVYAIFDSQDTPEWRYTPKGEEAVFNPIEIDPKPHYMHGGINHGNDNWLDFYQERNMIISPGKIKYVPWQTYTDKEPTFTTNPDAYNNFAETFYTPYQMYQLQRLQAGLTLKVKNESLIDKNADWAKMQQKIQPFFADLEALRSAIVQLNNEDALVMDINTIGDQFEHEQYEAYIQDRLAHGWPNEKDASKEALKDSAAKYPKLLSKYGDKIKQSLAKHNATDENLYDSMRRYLQLCSFDRIGLDLKARIAYLSGIKEGSLVKNEDPCERASLLIWALGAIDSKRASTDVKNEIISGIGKHCRFCYRRISKPRKNQSTCGREGCDRELSRVYKQEKRKSGLYNMR